MTADTTVSQAAREVELLALADRVEKATGPDREIDAAIAVSIRWHPNGPSHWMNDPDIEFKATMDGWMIGLCNGQSTEGWPSKEYTASLDVAMGLVPGRHKIAHISQCDSEKPHRQWFAEIRRGHVTSYDKCFFGWGTTPALALTAAALRALAALNPETPHAGEGK